MERLDTALDSVRCLAALQTISAARRAILQCVILGFAALMVATSCLSPGREPLDVYAASSLSEVFSELETQFEAEYPSVDIRLNIAGSSTLARQINAGAESDVFVPADVAVFAQLDDPPERNPTVVATNRLTLIIPRSISASTVRDAGDVERSDVIVARCADGVPCGDATRRFLEANNLTLRRASEQLNVRQVLRQVAEAEADAGFVYVSDALSAEAEVATIPLDNAPVVEPAIAVLSDNPLAEEFVEFVSSPSARETFREFSFEAGDG